MCLCLPRVFPYTLTCFYPSTIPTGTFLALDYSLASHIVLHFPQAVAPVSPTRAPVPGVFPPPPSSSASPYWVLAVDPATRRLFYHDVNSGVSTWVPPKEFEEAFAPPPPPPRLPSVSPPAPAPLLPREGNPHGGSGIAPPSPHNVCNRQRVSLCDVAAV